MVTRQAMPAVQPQAPAPGGEPVPQGVIPGGPPPPPPDWGSLQPKRPDETLPVTEGVNIPLSGTSQIPIDVAKGATRAALPLIGSVVGGIRGGPPGAGMGASAGEAIAMGAETLMGAPPSLQEFSDRMLSAAPTAMWSEIGGRAVTRGAQKLVAPFKKKLTDVGRQTIEFMSGKVTPAQAVDSHLLSTFENIAKGSIFGGGKFNQLYLDQAKLLRQRADEILGQFGPRTTAEEAGAALTAAEQAQFQAGQRGALGATGRVAGEAGRLGREAEALRTGIASRVGPAATVEDTGKAWQRLQEAARQSDVSVGNALFSEVDRLAATGGELVSLERMVAQADAEDFKVPEMARALTGKAGQLSGVVRRTGTEVVEQEDPVQAAMLASGIEPGKLPGGITSGRQAGPAEFAARDALLEALKRAEVPVEQLESRVLTFTQARNVRSALGEIIRDADRSGNSRLKGVASQFFKTIDEDMEAAAGGPDSELGKAFRTANNLWRSMKETFDEGVLKRAAEVEPRLVLDAIVKPGRVDEIWKARNTIGAEGWQKIAARHFQSLLTDEKTGAQVAGKELAKRLNLLKPETLDAIYGGKTAGELAQLRAALMGSESLAAQAAAGQKAVIDASFTPTPAHRAVSSIIQKGAVAPIEKMRAVVGDDIWRQVQASHAHDLLDDGGKLISGGKLLERLNKLTPETLKAAYPRGTDQGLWQLGRVMEQLQRKQPGTGSMYIQLAQGGVASGVFLGTGDYKTAGAILLGPAAISRILLNPLARKWLTTGLLQGRGSQFALEQAPRAATNLVAWLTREGLLPSSGRGGGPVPSPVESGRGGGAGPLGSGFGTPSGGPPPPPGPPPGPPR